MATRSERTGLAILILRLSLRGILYRAYKFAGLPRLPEALSIEVTTRCVARCIMCNIWKKRWDDLSLDIWLGLLRSSVFRNLRELDVTGGEPFLRDDLVRMVEGLLEEKRGNLRRLRSIAITTNGFLPERILSFTRGVIGRMEEAGLELVLAFSLDGVGELHGRIRRFPNAWERLMESIEGAKHIRERHRNLILGVKTTILPLNVRHLDAILDFTRQHGLFMILSPFIRTENRYENTDLMLGFSEEELGLMRQFLEQREIKWDFHRTMLISFLKTGRVKKPCSAGFNYFFIRANGDVYPCPLVKRSIGNFLLTPFGAILRSKALRTFRLDVGRLAECRTCTEPGLERYALPFEGFHCLRYLVGQGRRSFVELFNHMGLNKYL